MVEVVQRELEELLSVFESIEKFKLLTPIEVKRVIAKCKSFEYKLTKRPVEKSSFVGYIRYLIDFSTLVHERRKIVKFRDHKETIERNLSIKIGQLFKKACHRFKSDIDLWLSRIDYVKKKKLYFNLSKIYYSLLQVHSDRPGLWILAAQHEFDETGSTENARSLLQRALRFNPDSKNVWLELFRLELLFVDKLVKRRSILQPDKQYEPMDNEDVILEGKLASLVFRQAVQKIRKKTACFGNPKHEPKWFLCHSDEPDFCLQFAQLAKTIPLQFTENIIKEIVEYLENRFPDGEEKYDCLINYQFDLGLEELVQGDHSLYKENMEILEQICRQLYEKACEKLPTGKMMCLYLEFLVKRYTYAREVAKDQKFKILHAKFIETASKKQLPESFCTKWVNLCPEINTRREALQYCTDNYPKSVKLRCDHLKVLVESESDNKAIYKTFKKAFKELPEKESLPVWRLAIEWSIIAYPEKIEKLFEASFLRDTSISAPMKTHYLEYMFTLNGIESTRKAFKRLCQAKPNNWEFYRTYHKIEVNCNKMDQERVRKSFEHAVFEFGAENVDVWCDYFRFEEKRPQAPQIYSRALKTLANQTLVDEFVRRNIIK